MKLFFFGFGSHVGLRIRFGSFLDHEVVLEYCILF